MASSKPEYHMPGAYHFDNPPWPMPTLGSNVYLPPDMSGSILNLDVSTTASLYDSPDAPTPQGAESNTGLGAMKRKRMAHDSRETTPLTDWASLSAEPADRFPPFAQDQARTSIQYTLAGQIASIGTPGSNAMEESLYSDVDYRRALGPKRIYEASETAAAAGQEPGSAAQPPLEQWNVLHVLGNVVGKVWDFCRSGSFRGFHAGGGVGYDWETGKPVPSTANRDVPPPEPKEECMPERPPGTEEEAEMKETVMTEDAPRASYAIQADDSAPRASYAIQDDNDDTMSTQTQDLPLRRAGKRRQVSAAGEELRRNWVLVDSEQSRDFGGSRRSSLASPAARRLGAAATCTPLRRPGASLYSGTPDSVRRISLPVSRLGSTPTAHGVSHAGTPKLSPRTPASYAPSRSPRSASRASVEGRLTSRIPLPSSSFGAANPFARTSPVAVAAGTTGRPWAKGRHEPPPPSPTRPVSARRTHRRGRSSISTLSLSRSGHAGHAGGGGEDSCASPRLDPEARQLAARRHAEELDADAKMEEFNQRLQAMIRQGKEALGTSFEIEGCGEHEDWMDDD